MSITQIRVKRKVSESVATMLLNTLKPGELGVIGDYFVYGNRGAVDTADNPVKVLAAWNIENIFSSNNKFNILPQFLDSGGVTLTPTNEYDAVTKKYVDAFKTAIYDGTKIKTSVLPDSIFGKLNYISAWNATATGIATSPEKGDFYICSVAGTKNPAGTVDNDYGLGDWSVYNGTNWDKIDNTDAITMVNGRTGAIETYRGVYATGTAYKKGDFLTVGNNVYLVKANVTDVQNTAYTLTNYFLPLNYYEHPTSGSGALSSGLYKITVDVNGHITAASTVVKADITGLGIPATDTNTWRPIAINGSGVLNDTTTTINFSTSGSLTFTYAGGTITLAHKDTTGHKHIPSGGATGQVLKYSSDGTVAWSADNNTTYNEATPSVYGLLKIGYTTTELNRAVELSSGKAYISLPRQIPAVTLNGSSNYSPSFYAPTAAGSSGQILTSAGSGSPAWTTVLELTTIDAGAWS